MNAVTTTCLSLSLLLVSASPLFISCSDSNESATSPTGTLVMALRAKGPGGNLYRLRAGAFSIAGPVSAVANTEDDLDAESLDVDLPPGDYSVTLESGWFLERDTGDGTFARVEANLVSPAVQSFAIAKRKTTNVVFRFETTGGAIEFGGTLSLSIDVEESEPAPRCTWIGPVDHPIFTVLGDVGSITNALKVSDDGQTIISWTSSSGQSYSSRWTEAEGMVQLPTPEIAISSPVLINCDGSVITGLDNDTFVARVWTPGKGVRPLIGCPGFNTFTPSAMSEAGDVLAGICWNDDDPNALELPARWVGIDQPAMTLPGVTKPGVALDVSADGKFFAGLDDYDGTVFRWSEATGAEEVATILGGDVRLSGDGRCVIVLDLSGIDPVLVRWCDGVTTSIPLPSFEFSIPFRLLPNYDGTVVVVNNLLWRDGNAAAEPVLDALENAGVDLHQWGVLEVWDMTPDARVFVGTVADATNPNHKAAFRLVMPRQW